MRHTLPLTRSSLDKALQGVRGGKRSIPGFSVEERKRAR